MITHVTKLIPTEIAGNVSCELLRQDLLKLRDKFSPGRLFSESRDVELKVDCLGIYTLHGASEFTGGVNVYAENLDRLTIATLIEGIRNGEEILLDVEQ